jgi:cytochrome c551/c552
MAERGEQLCVDSTEDCDAKLLSRVAQASADVAANMIMPATSIVDEVRIADKIA